MENLKRHLFSSSRPAGGVEPRSVFHISNSSNDSLSQEVQDCYESIEEFKNALKNLDGAGTHLTESLTKSLKGSCYQNVGDNFAATFRNIYTGSQTVKGADQMKEMGVLLLNLKEKLDENNADNLPNIHIQTMCHVLMLFLRMQRSYHQFCHDKMAELIQKLSASKGIEDQGEVTRQLISMVLANVPSPTRQKPNALKSPSQSPRSSPKLKHASDGSGSPKTQTKATFKSSLLSLFDRKPSPDEAKSAFYVEMNPEATGSGTEGQDSPLTAGSHIKPANQSGFDLMAAGIPTNSHIFCVPDPQTMSGQPSIPCPPGFDVLTAGSQAETVLIEFDTPPGTMRNQFPEPHPNGASLLTPVGIMHMNGQLASEEELESVINLLSGVNSSSSPMQSIPENQVQGPVQLAVPQIYRMPSPASDSHLDELKPPKFQMHRRSEGCLDLSGVQLGRSTWPHHHRSSLPAVQPFSQRQLIEQQREATQHIRRYSHDIHMPFRPSAGYTAPSGGHLLSTSQWSFPGYSTWPAYSSINTPGSDTMNSSWSGVQDSSDLSDDSSSGEQFFAVGRDLVQAIDSKEESSDEDFDKDKKKFLDNQAPATDPHQDMKTTNTWPPNQPWSHSSAYLNSGSELLEESPPPHRPVQMQWSDPMSARSMWPAGPPGVSQQRSSQSMHGFGTLQ